MIETTRRSFLVGAGALAAALAVPPAAVAAPAKTMPDGYALVPRVPWRWMVHSIGETPAGDYVVELVEWRDVVEEWRDLAEKYCVQLLSSQASDIKVHHDLRALYGQCNTPVNYMVERIKVMLTVPVDRAVLLHPGEVVDFAVDSVGCDVTMETRVS